MFDFLGFSKKEGMVMNKRHLIVGLALIAPVSFAWAQKVDPNKLPQVSCSDLKFSSTFLDKYPMAPAACLEGRVYQGVKYGKFDAKVYLNSLPDFITVQLLDVSGNEMPNSTFSVKPKPGAVVYIDGKKTAPADLKVGQKVTFWVPENKMEANSLPAPTQQSWRVIPPPPKQ
jgi:hypothetical protein